MSKKSQKHISGTNRDFQEISKLTGTYVGYLCAKSLRADLRVEVSQTTLSLNAYISGIFVPKSSFLTFFYFFLEYKSAGVEESKTCFDFASAQKRNEIQPPTSETDGGCRGRISTS